MQEEESKPTKTARLALLGPAPLITGEDADAYEELRARVAADVAPKDILEEILVHDIVDLTWELLRLRRMKAGLFNATAYKSLRVVLKPLIDRDFQEQDSEVEQESEEETLERYLEENWARRIPAAVKRVDQLLQQAGLTMDTVNAQTLSENIEAMERIERMLAALEARRNAVLCEIDRRREALARPLRRTLEQLEDVEYKVIKPNQSKA